MARKVEDKMTWTKLIILDGNSILDTKQVVSIFYKMSHAAPEEGLADIDLLCNHDAHNGFCIRITRHSEIPENGKNDLGYSLAKIFSECGKIHHSVWRRETSLHLLSWKGLNRDYQRATRYHRGMKQ